MEESTIAVANARQTGHNWRNKAKFQKWLLILLAVIPAFGGYILFTLYPNLLSVYYSLLRRDGVAHPVFVGLDNYNYMLQDSFVWRALWHNALFMMTIPPLVIFISLILAYLLSNKSYRFDPFYKVLFFFPNVLSTVAVSLLWAFIYDGSFGLLNAGLRLIGIDIGNLFENILILTNGGPSGSTDVIGLYMFNLAFGASTSHNFGYASAIGMMLFVILVAAKLGNWHFSDCHKCLCIDSYGIQRKETDVGYHYAFIVSTRH